MEEDDDEDESWDPIPSFNSKELPNVVNEPFASNLVNLTLPNFAPIPDSNLWNCPYNLKQNYEYGDPEDAELSPAVGLGNFTDKNEEENVEDENCSVVRSISSEGSISDESGDASTDAMEIDDLQYFNHNVENADSGTSFDGIRLSSQIEEETGLSALSDGDFDASSIEDSILRGQGRRGASRGRYKTRKRGGTYGRSSASGNSAIGGKSSAKRGWRAVLERMGCKDGSGAHKRGHGRGRGRGRPPGSFNTMSGAQRGRKRGTRAIAEPSREFKKLQSEATQAFIIEGDLEKALVIARKAVQINPEIYAAHSLLSEVLLTMGRKEDSVGASFSGAHTKRDPKIWWSVADRTLELALGTDETEKREAFLIQAVYCFTMVLKFDSEDFDARMERMRLQVELGNTSKARRDCEKMLEVQPHNAELLRQLAELCVTTEETTRAKKLYDELIETYLAGELEEEDNLTWSFINIYLDLLDRLELWHEAVHKLRKLSRYLLGRSEETYWDDFDDDREWDIEDNPRRLESVGFTPGRCHLAAYGLGLPIELRIKLGLFRLRSGYEHYMEALGHFSFLDPENTEKSMVFDYDDLFRDVADALRMSENYGPALQFYTAMRRNPQISKSAYCSSMALCFRSLGYLDELEKCYKELIEENSKNYEAWVQLARLYEEQSRDEDYSDVVAKLQIAGKRRLLDLDPPNEEERDTAVADNERNIFENRGSAYGESSNIRDKYDSLVRAPESQLSVSQRLEKAKMNDQAARATYQRLRRLESAINDGDAEAIAQWLRAAAYLISDLDNYGHRDTQLLKRAERARQEKLGITDTLAQDLSLIEDASFREISFDEWLNITCQYAFFLAQRGDSDGCWRAMTKACEFSPFYQDKARSFKTYMCMIVCSVKLGNEEQLQNAARWFVKSFGYSANAYNFYTIAHHAYNGIHPRNVYNNGPSQKFMLRQLKSIDWAVMSAEARETCSFADLEKKLYARREEEHIAAGESLPEKHLPSAFSAYAHMLMSGGSYAIALSYYHRAYIVAPDDPILNLSIAVAFAQHALKRQSENRLAQIQIGASFLKRYKELRKKQNIRLSEREGKMEMRHACAMEGNASNGSETVRTFVIQQEINFNEGRFWHMLGLMHLAISAYERCLEAGRICEAKGNIENVLAGGHDDFNYGIVKSKDICEEGDHQADDGYGEKFYLNDINYTREAAFALQLIYIMGGDIQAAKNVTEEWLVI